jgi:hypothetical protein
MVRTILFARPAAKLRATGQRFQETRRRPSAGPGVAGAHAGLAEFRRIDAVEPDLDACDADAVAVDHLRGTDDVGGAPMGDEAGRGETGQRQAGEQHRAGAAVQTGNHPVPLRSPDCIPVPISPATYASFSETPIIAVLEVRTTWRSGPGREVISCSQDEALRDLRRARYAGLPGSSPRTHRRKVLRPRGRLRRESTERYSRKPTGQCRDM